MVTTTSPLEEVEGISYEELRSQLIWGYDGQVAPENLQHELIALYTTAWLIRKGAVTVRYGQHSYTAVAGQWIFPAMIWGWQEFLPGSEILSLRFLVRWVDRRMLFDHSATLILLAADYPDLEAKGKALVDVVQAHVGNVREYMLSSAISPTAHFEIQEKLHGWLGAYATTMRAIGLQPRLTQQRDERAVAAMRYVDDHPLASPFRDAAVARRVGISPSQLNRIFGKHFDTTPKRHFDERRREHASYALIYGHAQVKTIAYHLGFSSLPHFTKWFQRLTGQTPSAYRKTYQRIGS